MMSNRDEMNEKCKEIARLTTGGTSATVASRNHMTPLQAGGQNIREVKVQRLTGKNSHHPTCSHRRLARPNLPPPLRRKRSKPTSIVTSKIMSEMNMTMMLGLLVSMLVAKQMPSAIRRVPRIC